MSDFTPEQIRAILAENAKLKQEAYPEKGNIYVADCVREKVILSKKEKKYIDNLLKKDPFPLELIIRTTKNNRLNDDIPFLMDEGENYPRLEEEMGIKMVYKNEKDFYKKCIDNAFGNADKVRISRPWLEYMMNQHY